jgi:transposase-like protein
MNEKPSTTTAVNGTRPAETATQPPSMATPPTTEVLPKAKRRTFSADYKRRILREAELSTEPGAVGALLRREGLYSSHLTDWRRREAAGQLTGTTSKPRGRKAQLSAEQKENVRLRRENARLQKQVEQAELIIAAQKKVAELLDLVNQQHRGM